MYIISSENVYFCDSVQNLYSNEFKNIYYVFEFP